MSWVFFSLTFLLNATCLYCRCFYYPYFKKKPQKIMEHLRSLNHWCFYYLCFKDKNRRVPNVLNENYNHWNVCTCPLSQREACVTKGKDGNLVKSTPTNTHPHAHPNPHPTPPTHTCTPPHLMTLAEIRGIWETGNQIYNEHRHLVTHTKPEDLASKTRIETSVNSYFYNNVNITIG